MSSTTTEAHISSPAECPHCHAPADYSVHHGRQFCNICGKKVANVNEPTHQSTKSLLSAPADEPHQPPPSESPQFSTPEREAAPPIASVVGAEDDEEAFKHAFQSPPPPTTGSKQNRYVDPADANLPNSRAIALALVNQTTPHGTNGVSAPMASPMFSSQPAPTASPAPSSSLAASVAATPAPNAPASNMLTLTNEEFAALEASIREEMTRAHAEETEILTMEYETLSREHQRVTAEKVELQRTMEEMMESFAQVVSEADRRRSDFTAHQDVLEAESMNLRNMLGTARASLVASQKEFHALQAQYDDITLHAAQHEDAYVKLKLEHDALRAEHDTLRTSHDNLRRQAQEKLSASGHEYRILLTRNNEKDLEIAELTQELNAISKAKSDAESALHEYETQLHHVEMTCDARTKECTELHSSLSHATTELNDYRVRMTDSQAIIQRYKEQIIELREGIRTLEENSRTTLQYEDDLKLLIEEQTTLTKENQQLKSQLFDSMQLEKTLRAQMENSAAASSSSSGADAAELAELRTALATKETEYNELMTICTELISQVEVLKAGQTKGEQAEAGEE